MTIDRRPIIGVMGSHEKEWSELAAPIGRMIAEHDYHLLTGAGPGAMTAVARSFISVRNRKGVSIGIVPTSEYQGGFVNREEYPNPYVEIPIITPLDKKAQGDSNPYSRNYVNVMTSHALIFLPGDHGTKNEASLALMFNKPSIYFGPDSAFAGFPEQRTQTENLDEIREFLANATAKFRTGEDISVDEK